MMSSKDMCEWCGNHGAKYRAWRTRFMTVVGGCFHAECWKLHENYKYGSAA